jgi:hypothetical protein
MATRAIEPPTLRPERKRERALDRPPALAATAAEGRARPQGRGIVLIGERTRACALDVFVLVIGGRAFLGGAARDEAPPRGVAPPPPCRRPRRLRLP